ncbi:hypothetical protein JW887_04430 [Candidatus Dojkabacteria bacterium]|nr:hypothetical protein [Candidatus Dojkabacteria bacterium]
MIKSGMFTNLLNNLNAGFTPIIQIVYWLVFFIAVTFIMWKSFIEESRKLKAPDDVLSSDFDRFISFKLFDFLFISIFISLFFARFLYIFYNPDRFSEVRWFYLPYEKINEEVYWMASFPWLFFRFTDGGFLLEGVFLGLLISSFLSSRVLGYTMAVLHKSIEYKVSFASFFILIYGAIIFKNETYFISGISLILLMTVIGLTRNFVNKMIPTKILPIFQLLRSLILVLAIPLIILFYDQNTSGIENSQFLLIINIFSVAIGVYIVIGAYLEKFLMNFKRNSQASGSADFDGALFPAVSIQGNRKVPADVANSSFRSGTRREALSLKPNLANSSNDRKFTMSFKDFSGISRRVKVNDMNNRLEQIRGKSKKNSNSDGTNE